VTGAINIVNFSLDTPKKTFKMNLSSDFRRLDRDPKQIRPDLTRFVSGGAT